MHHVFETQQESPEKNAATLSSLGILANSEAFCKQLVWARDLLTQKGQNLLMQNCLAYFQW